MSSYVLFTLDKLVQKVVKQVQLVLQEEQSHRLVELWRYEAARGVPVSFLVLLLLPCCALSCAMLLRILHFLVGMRVGPGLRAACVRRVAHARLSPCPPPFTLTGGGRGVPRQRARAAAGRHLLPLGAPARWQAHGAADGRRQDGRAVR